MSVKDEILNKLATTDKESLTGTKLRLELQSFSFANKKENNYQFT